MYSYNVIYYNFLPKFLKKHIFSVFLVVAWVAVRQHRNTAPRVRAAVHTLTIS